MTGLHVGKAGARRFALPTDIATQTSAILGIRGSGKTVTATVLVEELLEIGWPVVVIDPTDVWWGLKSRGGRAGYPVVVLGDPRTEHVDLPLTADSGTILADFAVERRVPMVLSLRHLRKNDQRRFVTAFAEQLYHRKGELAHRTPLLVVIDEASAFVPQRVQGESARMVGAIEDLVRRGRAAGIGVLLVDQRPASVNKDVLTQLEVLVAHRVTSPQDTSALKEWIKLHDTEGRQDEFLAALSSLPTGTAWFWSPALDLFAQVAVRMRHTVDSSRTPKAGEKPVHAGKLASVDLEALRAELEETIAEAEANDPRALRRRISELERELRAAKPDPEAVARAVEAATAELEARTASIEDRLERGHALALELVTALATSTNGKGAPRAPTPAPPVRKAAVPRPTLGPTESVHDLPVAQVRILDALATLEGIGVEAVSRTNLALFARQSPKSSTYGEHVSALQKAGFVTYPGTGMVALTPEGRAQGAPSFSIATAEDLHGAWLSYLADGPARILRALLDVYPSDVDRTELAGMANQSPRSSTYGEHIALLKGLGAVEYPGTGRVRATDLLFPAGLRA